jgi:hypothetical protein
MHTAGAVIIGSSLTGLAGENAYRLRITRRPGPVRHSSVRSVKVVHGRLSSSVEVAGDVAEPSRARTYPRGGPIAPRRALVSRPGATR